MGLFGRKWWKLANKKLGISFSQWLTRVVKHADNVGPVWSKDGTRKETR